MTFADWQLLSEAEQKKRCQYLDPYEDKEILLGVEDAFKQAYGHLPGVSEIHCGLGPFIGPYNSLFVTITDMTAEKHLPQVFLGFPVISESKILEM